MLIWYCQIILIDCKSYWIGECICRQRYSWNTCILFKCFDGGCILFSRKLINPIRTLKPQVSVFQSNHFTEGFFILQCQRNEWCKVSIPKHTPWISRKNLAIIDRAFSHIMLVYHIQIWRRILSRHIQPDWSSATRVRQQKRLCWLLLPHHLKWSHQNAWLARLDRKPSGITFHLRNL